jgi:hypothetical protein
VPSDPRLHHQFKLGSHLRFYLALSLGPTISMAVSGCVSAPRPRETPQQPASSLGSLRAVTLTPDERRWDCTKLRYAMAQRSVEIKALQEQVTAELKTPAPTLERMLQRASGKPETGNSKAAELRAVEQQVLAYQDGLKEKACGAAATTAPQPTAK